MRLYDSFGRRFSYLRLSVTDACNFRCVYCLPNGYQRPCGEAANYLSLTEIRNLCQAFAELGMWKIRLTGGEPLLRRDLIEIIQMISQISGVQKIALSTNGYRLKQGAQELFKAGVTHLNVSVDSLNPKRFAELTGLNLLNDVLSGIEMAQKVGFSGIKVNSVLLKESIEEDLPSFLAWIRHQPLTVRFIELMPTGQNSDLFKKSHIQSGKLREELLKLGWSPRSRQEGDGPAIEFEHPDSLGKVGIIAPYSKDFCSTCNRLRVTSQGGLRLCLFGEGSYSLRHLLQDASQKEKLKEFVQQLLYKKDVSHYLPEGRYGNNQTFSAMGG